MVESKETYESGIYHIRVKGSLDDRWADWFEGFVIASRGNDEMLFAGSVVDQAALHGVLGKIRGLGLPLLLVRRTDCPCRNRGCARRGHCQACAAAYRAKGKLPYCFRVGTRWDKQCAVLAKPA